jgi:hypothetical protein
VKVDQVLRKFKDKNHLLKEKVREQRDKIILITDEKDLMTRQIAMKDE